MLLAQLPNSSSAVTLGAELKPPPVPGTIGVLANEELGIPHPNSVAGDLGCPLLLGMAAGAGGAEGAGAAADDHSLVPQTSTPGIPGDPKAVVVVAVEVVGTTGLLGGAERLKTEFALADGGEVTCGCGGGAGLPWATGADRSKRSPMADDDWESFEAGAAATGVGAADPSEENAPSPKLDGLSGREAAAGWAGLFSKKLPPLKPPKALAFAGCGATARLLEDALPRLAKGSANAAGFCGLVGLDNVRLPRASWKPPPAEPCR